MDRSILRIIISVFISIVALPAVGQIISSQAVIEQSTPNGDQIFIYNIIQSVSLRHAVADTVTVNYEWFEHNPVDNSWTKSLQIQNGSVTTLVVNKAGGYGLRITNNLNEVEFYRCWVFEPSINNANIEVMKDTCDFLSLQATYEQTPLIYYDELTGATTSVPYETTFNWSATPSVETIANEALINIAAPVENTKYELIIAPFGNSTQAFSTILEMDYTAIAVKAAYKAEEMKSDVPQEVHKDLTEGSAPIELRFTDESKGHVTAWEWQFTGSKVTKSERNPFHIFTVIDDEKKEGVKDSVLLTVKNHRCISTVENPLVVHAFKSLLEAPNTFTPNGDGSNDEFRVVYRSIKKYKILIFNRWGRIVYESSNPAEGWDGKIGNTQAAPGVYFYTIEAEGYLKGEKHSLQGPIHLIRGK